MNRKKLLNSKWTAIKPKNKEKHFTVTKVQLNEEDPQIIEYIVLTAVMTKKNYKLHLNDLQDHLIWTQGWK